MKGQMKKPCGCCGSDVAATPESEYNRPGLPALRYRVGTYATFREAMLERLSSVFIDVPASDRTRAIDRLYPLKPLTTRQASDPSIALLDAWAVLADVLTFYQERIANEGYLITASERRSVLELARLVGYRLRPGVSASVFLAFTVADDFDGEIPVGARAQSIPGTDETAQYFETSFKLPARTAWNNLRPRLTRPIVISPPPDPALKIDNHLGTNADIIDSLYVRGVSTNLKAGDALLLVLSDDPHQQFLRLVERVDAQSEADRTRVALRELHIETAGSIRTVVRQLVQRFIDDAPNQFVGSDLATQAAALLGGLLDLTTVAGTVDAAKVTSYARGLPPQIQALHDVAVSRQFTRVEIWLQHLLDLLPELVATLAAFTSEGTIIPIRPVPSLALSSLERLGTLLPALSRPVSVQPANPIRLSRSVAASFASHSDMMPRLIAALNPVAAPLVYSAWGKVQPEHIQLRTYAVRAKAGLFAASFPGPATFNRQTQTTVFNSPSNLANTWKDLIVEAHPAEVSVIALDAVYDKIAADSWVAVSRPDIGVGGVIAGRTTSYHKVIDVQTMALDTRTGFAAKVTVLTLATSWLNGTTQEMEDMLNSSLVLRGTIVYTQAEELDLAEIPLDRDVEGDSIELDGLYDGLQPGRWIIVSGERTDIPNVSAVKSSELAMIAGVTQGAGKESCVPFLPTEIPFDSLFYISDDNAAGDRLVVGVPSSTLLKTLAAMPPPESENQQFCERVQLAPGVYADAYVPSALERVGNFSAFADQLVDPQTVPQVGAFPGGIIPTNRQDTIFAWRIKRLTSGSESLHTTIQLASPLNYKYDTAAVTIYANVAKATHGQTTGEVLGNGDASQTFQTLALHQKPLTYVSAATAAGAESTLTTRVNEIAWHEADALTGLGPTDRSFVTDTDDADQTTVVFGNGAHGARVPTGSSNIKATYRYGIGSAGNVRPWQISQLATHPLGLQGVVNPLAASGGADRDTIDQARRNAPLAVTALDRLVSVQDYADFARTYAGIGKASAVRLSDGRNQLVHLTIAGVGDIPIDPSSDLYQNLVLSLQTYGDPLQPVQVCWRRVKLLVISAGVRLEPDYLWESVEPKIRAALLAGFAVDVRDLGQPAYLSEAIGMMQAVEGVASVDPQIFDAVSETVTVKALSQLAGTLTLNASIAADLARRDPTAGAGAGTAAAAAAAASADPCARIRPAELVFLTPYIPDTLILTEIGA